MKATELVVKYHWNMPTICPACGAALEIDESSGRLFCPNVGCSQKVEHKVMKMSNEWGILGLGPAIVSDLVKTTKIKSLSEFFENVFTSNDLDNICGKNADKIRKNLKDVIAKPMTTAKYLAAFDMEGFGAKKIQTAVDAGWTITNPDVQLANVKGWTSDSAYDFNSKVQYDIVDIKSLLLRIKINDEKEAVAEGGKLAGKSFCFTGAMAYKRADLEKMVVDNGGTISAVNKTLNYLVQADPNSTSSKSEKAKKFGTKIITPEEFLKMVN